MSDKVIHHGHLRRAVPSGVHGETWKIHVVPIALGHGGLKRQPIVSAVGETANTGTVIPALATSSCIDASTRQPHWVLESIVL